MTKTLTEQWKDGTLPEGYYYVKCVFYDDISIFHLDYEVGVDGLLPVKEVLAEVPSYEELNITDEQIENLQKMCEDECSRRCRLEEQLAIATKALKEYTKPAMWELDGFCYMDADTAINALKEIKEVK